MQKIAFFDTGLIQNSLKFLMCSILSSLCIAGVAQASSSYTVVGVIADAEPAGVALLRKGSEGTSFAVKIGSELESGLIVASITREHVIFQKGNEQEIVRVGDESGQSLSKSVPSLQGAPNMQTFSYEGIERQGGRVRISASLRDQVIKRDLSKVLMQAAAVPYYSEGALKGFKITNIDTGSIYELAGIADGDIVTAINDQQITDVATTIRMLHALKEESRAELTLLRNGAETKIELLVQ